MTPTVRLKIDGTEVEVDRGKMILDAAGVAGVRIPTLCHDRRLIPYGACRLCVVQQKGKRDLQLACFTPARDGMEIITQSPEITESRRFQLQLILLNHPMACPRCEKEGSCALQRLVYEYGVEEIRYPWEKIHFPEDKRSSLLQRDPDRCILCGRCVRICDEIQGVGELSFTGRGIQSSIDTDFHRPLACEFCGQCLDTCPVAAITSDCFDYTVKPWELTETTTPCPYCGCGCLLTIGSRDGKIRVVSSGDSGGPNDGNLCVRGRFGWDVVDHPDRIRTPLLRTNGSLKEASWEDALQFTAAELERIKTRSDSGSIAALLSGRLTNEEYFLCKKLFQETLNTDRINLSGQGGIEALARTLGFPASTNSIRELRKADCILMIGVDPAQTHPIVKNEAHLAIRKNRAQLIVLGHTDIGHSRNTQIPPLSPPALLLLDQPGMEVTILNEVIRVLLSEGLEDKGFIEGKTEGMESLRKHLASQEHAGVTARLSESVRENLERAARAFSGARRSMILIGAGEGSPLPIQSIVLAASNLALVTGHIGKPSSGILFLQERCNNQGAFDLGIHSGGGEEKLLGAIEGGTVKALYLVGEDPVGKTPDPERMEKALGSLQLLVVQDPFLTEAAKKAHVVLPAAPSLEKEGSFTSLERRVQRLQPFRSPLHDSKPDFDIFLQLLLKLESPAGEATPASLFREMTHPKGIYQLISYGEQWPQGVPFLYADGFPKGKAKFVPVPDSVPDRCGKEEFPLRLVQRESLFRSGLFSRKSDHLNRVAGQPSAEVHPDDALKWGLQDGENVRLSNPEGKSLKLKATVSKRIVPGVVTVPFPCPLIGGDGTAFIKIERIG